VDGLRAGEVIHFQWMHPNDLTSEERERVVGAQGLNKKAKDHGKMNQ
jgi:hypothetical protein